MNTFAMVLGALFATYFLVYPVVYFAWNFAIAGAGYPQYQIPGFWVGMAFFLVFMLVKNGIRGGILRK